MMSRRIFRKCQLPAGTIKEQFPGLEHYISISVGWVYITFPSLPHPCFSFSQELIFPQLSFSYNFIEIIKFKLIWQELFSCLFSRDPSHFFHPYFLQFHLHEIMSHCRDYFFYQIFHLKPDTGSVNAGMTADILAI